MGILLPALNRARIAALDVRCLSNARQIALGFTIYATENQSWLPPAQEFPGTGDGGTRATWHVRLWIYVIGQSFPGTDFSQGGTYAYLKQSIFECPQAERSKRSGYNTSDHRRNGYAMNISTPGSGGQAVLAAGSQQPRIAEYKKISKPVDASRTLLITDSVKFFVEYYDRGSSTASMDVGFSDAGGMLDALGRHGTSKDIWHLGFFDGSVRSYRFNDVPEAPIAPVNYYNVGNRLTPAQVLTNTNFSEETRIFWVGLRQ